MRTFIALVLLGIILAGIVVGAHTLLMMSAEPARQAAEALAPAPCKCQCDPCRCCKGCRGQK